MSIDIITTTYRNTSALKICLETVIEKTKFVDYKWYVMANDPNDEVKKTIHDGLFIDDIQFNDRIVPIYNDNNDGSFSSNNNELAKEGNGEYILLLNDDIEPINENWLINMKNVLDQDKNIGAVGALLVYPDKKTVQHCGVMFSHRTNNLPFHMFYRQPLQKIKNFISATRYYQAVTGACILVRRNDFEYLEGLDERFFYGFEDVSLCLDLQHKLKKKCVYIPSAQLIHHEGISGSFKDHPKLQDNIKALREKHRGQFFNDEMFYINNPNYMIYK